MARYGVALMLQVSEEDCQVINEKLYVIFHPRHVTIAYLTLPDEQLAERARRLGIAFLEEKLSTGIYSFCVEACLTKFGHITAFEPTEKTVTELKKLNHELEEYLVAEGFVLNPHTNNDQYLPHITLSRKIIDFAHLHNINQAIRALKSDNPSQELCFKLTTATFIMKQIPGSLQPAKSC